MIGYGGFSGVHIPIWVTKEFGLLEKHQLKGDLVMIPGSSRQMQGLISGSIQFSHIDSTGPITAIQRGAELVTLPAHSTSSRLVLSLRRKFDNLRTS